MRKKTSPWNHHKISMDMFLFWWLTMIYHIHCGHQGREMARELPLVWDRILECPPGEKKTWKFNINHGILLVDMSGIFSGIFSGIIQLGWLWYILWCYILFFWRDFDMFQPWSQGKAMHITTGSRYCSWCGGPKTINHPQVRLKWGGNYTFPHSK